MAGFKCVVVLVSILLVYEQQTPEVAAANTGTKFILSPPPNYNHLRNVTLMIESKHQECKVFINSQYTKQTTNMTVHKGVTKYTLQILTTYHDSGLSKSGILIQSEKPVSIHLIDKEDASTDGLLVLPIIQNSTEFYAVTYTPDRNSQITVTALEDNTVVNITVKYNTGYLEFNGLIYQDGHTIQTTLNNLDVAFIKHDADLTGTHIVSNKPIAVISGNECTYIPDSSRGACDHIIEQIPPISAWGDTYIVSQFRTQSSSILRVISAFDNTHIYMGHLGSVVKHKGEYIQKTLSADSTVVIQANHPVMVIQYAEGGLRSTNGDPFMMVIPPVKHFSSDYIFSTPSLFHSHHVTITIDSRYASGLRLNGNSISRSDEHQATVNKNGDISHFSVIRFDIAEGDYTLTHTDNTVKFGALLYGFAYYESYGFPLGYELQEIPKFAEIISTTCSASSWNVDVDMSKLNLRYPGSVPTDIYLGENKCTGQLVGTRLRFSYSIDSCQTIASTTFNELVYSNQLIYAYHDPLVPYIVRNYNWTIDLTCLVLRNESTDSQVSYNQSIGSNLLVNGTGKYQLNMAMFSDPNFLHVIPGNPIRVSTGTNIYVKAYVDNVDWDIKMKLNSCYTTPTSDDTSTKYYIIKDGCEMDANTHVISTSAHETRFVFPKFDITTSHGDVYLHCDAVFCDVTNSGSATLCRRQCGLG